jgi:hypothetical protein
MGNVSKKRRRGVKTTQQSDRFLGWGLRGGGVGGVFGSLPEAAIEVFIRAWLPLNL